MMLPACYGCDMISNKPLCFFMPEPMYKLVVHLLELFRRLISSACPRIRARLTQVCFFFLGSWTTLFAQIPMAMMSGHWRFTCSDLMLCDNLRHRYWQATRAAPCNETVSSFGHDQLGLRQSWQRGSVKPSCSIVRRQRST